MVRLSLIYLTMITAVILTAGSESVRGQILSDSFENDSLGWEFESRAGNFGIPTASTADFGFDYSQFGIPEAPNTPEGDASTTGLRIRTNLIGVSEDQAAVFLEDERIAGRYSVQVDMWLNWAPDPNLIGTTLHAGPFVGWSTDDNPTEQLKPISRGAGILMSSDGDCGNCDYILLKNEAELDLFSGQYSAGAFVTTTDDDDNEVLRNQPGIDDRDVTPSDFNGDGMIDSADFTVWRESGGSDIEYEFWAANYGFPALDLPEAFPELALVDAVGDAQPTEFINEEGDFEPLVQRAGVVGFRWVTLNIDVDPFAIGNGSGDTPGLATFSITSAATQESILIGTVDNSVIDDPNDGHDSMEGPVDMEGFVSLSLIDFFAGGPADLNLGFVLYDNLQITTDAQAAVPEPNTNALVCLGAIGLLFGRRRFASNRVIDRHSKSNGKDSYGLGQIKLDQEGRQ